MDATETAAQDSQVAGPSPADAAGDCYAEILSVSRAATTRHAYFARVLRAIGQTLNSPCGAIYIRCASEVIQDDCHFGPTDPRFWKDKLQAFLTDSLSEYGTRAKVLRAKDGGDRIAFLAAPVFDPSGAGIGAMAFVVAPFEEDNVAARLAWLESISRLASYAAAFLNAPTDKTEDSRSAGPNQALSRAASSDTPEQLAFAITNSLRNKLGCEQVALGMVLRRRAKLLSISGLDQVAPQSTGVVHLRAAMEECYDAGQPIVCQAQGNWADNTASEYRIHRQWYGAAKGDAVASIPLRANDEVVAILSLRRRGDQPFTRDLTEEVRSRVEPFAPALLLARKAARGIVQHVADSVHDASRALLGRGRIGTKVVTAAVVLGLGWFTFGKMSYELAVPCTVGPAHIRHVTVPFDGMLSSATALQGDRVQQGDVLCEMDHRDLDQQRAELMAEIAVLEREQDRARAGTSPVDVQLAMASQRLAQAKLDIANTRLERAVIRSPIAGIVVAGDLRKKIGCVMTRGEPLFRVAPVKEWRLELQVPETDADDLREGLSGFLVPHARPEEAQQFRITRVRPQAEVVDEKTVYVAEADIDLPFAWMRPGMEGVAKVEVGRRRVWWVVFHRAIEYVRLNLWL